MRRFHELSPQEYAKLDIGEVNLECAAGLCGSEDLNTASCLAKLDEWAELIRFETKRSWFRFERNPKAYNRSRVYFRMLVMVTVLQRDLGVHYDLESLESPFDATDSRLHFIHGILQGLGGTCANLPVLYVAIGRRLDYPLKLVQAVEHWFVRWDDPNTNTKLNIEATSQGLNCQPDEYYKNWPKPMQQKLIDAGWLLKSMTPREELSAFYEMRGRCFSDTGQYRNAMEMAYYASRLCDQKNPFREGFHSVATVLWNSLHGRAKYGFQERTGGGTVRENGIERPMRTDEAWAVRQAEEQLARLKSIHQSKLAKMPKRESEEVFARLATDPGYVR